MTIYELEKQATPGPWAVDEHRTRGTDIRGPDGEAVLKTEKWVEDIALAVHCRNNFLKALEALKEEHKDCERLYEKEGYEHIPEFCEICLLIKELEEVCAAHGIDLKAEIAKAMETK